MDNKKSIFYYVDESGTLDSPTPNDRFFILSCYITDVPDTIQLNLEILRETIVNDPYFASKRAKFESDGFHACDNHPDIRTKYYSLLYALSLRIYSVVLDRESDVYKDLVSRHKDNKDIYYELLYSLLKDRLIRNKDNHNVLIFEEYGSKPMTHKIHIEEVINSIIRNERLTGLSYEVEVHDKSDLLLSVIDYVNYVLFQLLHKELPGMRDNFKLIEPKIALLHHLDKKVFYAEKKRINFEEIKGQGKVNK